jgi:RNA polymerase subunit RPABC4/transcription elongation factor Spt4
MSGKRKVCKVTKKFMDDKHHEDHTPPEGTTTNWKGRMFILNPDKSMIAKKTGKTDKGEYAIKV